MPNLVDIVDMKATLAARAFPSITIWNRLEGRPRSVDFERALRAEVRDALWMLTRQWQMGEFQGDDAGTPVTARFVLSAAPLTGFQPREGPAQALDRALPLEAQVERRSITAALEAGGLGCLDLRLAMGRRFLKRVPSIYHAGFIAQHRFIAPDPDDPALVERSAHPDVLARLQLLAGRAMDGYRLYRHLKDVPGARAWDGVPVLDEDKPAVVTAGNDFVAWWEALLVDAPAEAFDPQRLEHRFNLTAPVAGGTRRLQAEEYPGGRLDWTAFSVDPAGAAGSGPLRDPMTVLPAPARFNGMPDKRWWAFEDGRTNFGAISADRTDLARLLYVEFGLVYSNDWYVVPVDLDVGVTARVEGLVVTNVFGDRRWIEAAGRGQDDDWQRWSMFTLDVAGTDPRPADMSLLLLPTLAQTDDGPPLEDVLFLRDEIANLVWGVERTVPLATGIGRRGAEAADQTLAGRTRLLGHTRAAADPTAPIAYRVMGSAPEHWIPFVPMHVPGDVRETQLQRAALPRLIEGGPKPPERVRPRTTLLRQGLDQRQPVSYVVHEEAVPRAGAQVSVGFQRTRWRDGGVCVWLATRRQTGRGEGVSTLAFDSLVPSPPKEAAAPAVNAGAPRAPAGESREPVAAVTAAVGDPGALAPGLRGPRFTGDPVLKDCLDAAHRMMAPEQGLSVKRVQSALLELGYSVGLAGDDGVFGPATGAAVVAYKTDRKLSPNDPVVGPGTTRALDDDLYFDPPSLDPAFGEFAPAVLARRLEPFVARELVALRAAPFDSWRHMLGDFAFAALKDGRLLGIVARSRAADLRAAYIAVADATQLGGITAGDHFDQQVAIPDHARTIGFLVKGAPRSFIVVADDVILGRASIRRMSDNTHAAVGLVDTIAHELTHARNIANTLSLLDTPDTDTSAYEDTALAQAGSALGVPTVNVLSAYVNEIVARHVQWIVRKELGGTPGGITLTFLAPEKLAAAALFYFVEFPNLWDFNGYGAAIGAKGPNPRFAQLERWLKICATRSFSSTPTENSKAVSAFQAAAQFCADQITSPALDFPEEDGVFPLPRDFS
jgi:putative peptidoglycan binding protein